MTTILLSFGENNTQFYQLTTVYQYRNLIGLCFNYSVKCLEFMSHPGHIHKKVPRKASGHIFEDVSSLVQWTFVSSMFNIRELSFISL